MKRFTWARPAGAPEMHAIYTVADSVAVAACDATWLSADTVEVDANPAHGYRCDGCVGVLVDARMAELGVVEVEQPGMP